ncbi:MAG TPA: hypothetical protein VEZ13_02735 [Brevibacillus sp.]|nr:hypothetical protein [Brevibacillus sp.]
MFAQKSTDELQSLLMPIRKRLGRRQLMRHWTMYGLGGMGGSVLLLLVARLWPIPHYPWLALAILVLALVAGSIVAWSKQPTWLDCAKTADGQGLAQRTVTAWEHRDSETAIALRQREDALSHLRRQIPQIVESIQIWPTVRRQTYVIAGLVLASTLLFLLPNIQDERLAQIALEQQAMEEAQETLEEIQEETQTNNALTEAQKKELNAMLEQAKQALAKAQDPMDRLNALRAAEKQLEKWRENEARKQAALQRLQQALAGHQATQSLAEAMSQGDREALTKALQELAKAMEGMSVEEINKLTAVLEQSAGELAQEAAETNAEDAKKIAEQLSATAQQLSQGQIPQALTALEQGLTQGMQAAGQSQQGNLAAAQAAASLQQSQMTLASAGAGTQGNMAGAMPTGQQTQGSGQATPASGTPAPGNGTNQPSAGNNQGSGAPGQGIGANTGSQPGAPGDGGAGQGAGTGNGNGTGTGNGNGTGAGNGAGSGNGGNGVGQGSGAGLGDGRHELVTVPSQRITEPGGPTDTVSGPLGEGASQTRQSSNAQVSSGGTLPYAEVYGEYAQFARESLEKGNIPGDYQAIVKEYFSNIEP